MLVVVCGTGTEVGKTHVACALLRAWRARGEHAIGLKPIATGVDGSAGDAERLAAASGGEPIAPRYAFAPAISPHLAARRAGVSIDIDAVAAWVAAAAGKRTVVESAGGLFSPLGERTDNAVLARALSPSAIVLVAADRLGVLHDVTAALKAWRAESEQPLIVALSAPASADASTGTNAAELERLGILERWAIARAVVFPRANESAPETLRAAADLADAISAGLASGRW